ncbi:MAG: enterochelin esterase, partial [Chitinimonas sp.]|nr:enterochelin esterase [Chitinimonas sp.]
LDVNPVAPETAAWLQAVEVGSERWWQAVAKLGAPLCEPVAEDSYCITFLWRDPAGDESRSGTQRVYIDVNSVTNHHAFDPESLQRIAGTDVWYWQVLLPASWRGSYAFIPVDASQLPPVAEGKLEDRRDRHRQWWRSIMGLAQADALNPLPPHASGWAGMLSALHLPGAPDQSAWHEHDRGEAQAAQHLKKLHWQSDLLGNQRAVWVYACGQAETPAEQLARPLVLLLDGQHWAERMPIFSALAARTEAGDLPAAVYVLIDVIDGGCRQAELSCNPLFWQAVQHELLPWVAGLVPSSSKPARTVVAGQSLGGLAALYAGLHHPQRFGAVLSQSGSFWWPYVELLQAPPGEACPRKPGSRGRLAELLTDGTLPPGHLRVFLEVGSREDVMIDLNDSVYEGLRQAGHTVIYQQFEGGHDWLCWRGGLLDGLACLLAPPGGMHTDTDLPMADQAR